MIFSMERYESNSYKSREKKDDREQVKVKKVANGKTKKKSKFKNALMSIIASDADDLRSSIFSDLVVPTIKEVIYGLVGIILDGRISSRRRDDGGSRRAYNKIYDDNRRYSSDNRSKVRVLPNYEDIIVNSYGEANAIFEEMQDVIDRYGFVSIGQLYEIAGIDEGTLPFTYNNWGWTNIATAEPVRCRDGYLLKLPKPVTWD